MARSTRHCARLLASALLALTPLACSSTSLPESRPSDLSVSVNDGAGMYPAWERVAIGPDGGIYTERYEEAERELRFAVSDAELDALWQVFRETRIDRITTYEEEVYDRGGTSLNVSYGDRSVGVSDSGRSFVSGSWREQYNTALGAVHRLAAAAMEPARVEVVVALDSSMAGVQASIAFNDRNISVDGEGLTGPMEVTARELPGPVMLHVSVRLEVDPGALYLVELVEIGTGRRYVLSHVEGALQLTVES